MSSTLEGWYCYVYHSHTRDPKTHLCKANGLPKCGSKVDEAALEYLEGKPEHLINPCKRCFKSENK